MEYFLRHCIVVFDVADMNIEPNLNLCDLRVRNGHAALAFQMRGQPIPKEQDITVRFGL
jgi:hypothetical protein